MLKDIEKRMSQLGRKGAVLEDTDKLVDRFFNASNSLKKHKTQYMQRLRYGLREYYLRNYLNPENEE